MSPSTSKLNLRAFSLVEVVMAIGVVAMAFVPLLGLIPSGLRTFRESMDTAIGSQIAQKVITEALRLLRLVFQNHELALNTRKYLESRALTQDFRLFFGGLVFHS